MKPANFFDGIIAQEFKVENTVDENSAMVAALRRICASAALAPALTCVMCFVESHGTVSRFSTLPYTLISSQPATPRNLYAIE